MSIAAPNIIHQRPLLQKQRIAVEHREDRVALIIGNTEMEMDYETALQLSQWLRVRGKQAKNFAGDISRHWSVIGVLTDAEQTRG